MIQDVVPFYVLCDESHSVRDHIGVLHAQLDELFLVLGRHRHRAAIWTSVIGFSRTARLLSPLVKEVGAVRPDASGQDASSNFGAAFHLVRSRARADRQWLADQGRCARSPVVLFFSDGLPTDPASWPRAHRALGEDDATIVAFGVGEADAATLRRIDTSGSFSGSGCRHPSRVAEAIATRLAGPPGSPAGTADFRLLTSDT